MAFMLVEKLERSKFKSFLTKVRDTHLIGAISSRLLPPKQESLVFDNALQIVGRMGMDSFMTLAENGGANLIAYNRSIALFRVSQGPEPKANLQDSMLLQILK